MNYSAGAIERKRAMNSGCVNKFTGCLGVDELDAGQIRTMSLEAAYDQGLISDADVAAVATGEVNEMLLSISTRTLLRLAGAYGGRMALTVPKNLRWDHPLVALLGQEDADQLSALFQLERISVPKLVQLRVRMRQRAIVKLHEAGRHADDIARRFEVTDRYVFMILARAREEAYEATP